MNEEPRIPIEKNVPLPKGWNSHNGPYVGVIGRTMKVMEVGDSIVIHAKEFSQAKSVVGRMRRAGAKRRFTMRKQGEFYRVWRTE